MLRSVFLTCFCVSSSCFAEGVRPRATVFYAHDSTAISGYAENPELVRKMVNALLLAVTGKADASDAWSTLVTPADRVGIKVAASGGPFFSSHKTIVETVADGIMRAGVPRKNIIVWDRADMSAFPRGNYIVRSMEPITGYDSRSIFTAPLMGKLIWGDASFTRKKPGRSSGDEAEELSGESHFCKVLGQLTKIVNVPVLSSAESCGVAGCLYNATIPNVDNWRRFVRAPDPALCELYRDARIGPKVVLNIVDGLIAQFAGGPDFQPSYAWAYATIFASKDPVALDAVALREIENWRAQAHLPSLAGQATYLQTADAMGLGRSAPEEIDIGGVWPK